MIALLASLAFAEECAFEKVTLPSNAPADDVCARRADPHPAELSEGVARVRAAWQEAFGSELPADRIGWTDWGYVSLPFDRFLTLGERAAVQAEERMVTDEQREKATSALGPVRDGAEVYTHFLGADTRFTDFWGHPETIAALLRLASGWHRHCVTELGADPRHCTLQIGDIAYFGPVRPDPLGHYDHYEGRCTDLRLFRDDGSRYEAWYNKPDDRQGVEGGYDATLTGAFVAYAVAHAPHGDFFFNDPAVHGLHEAVEPRKNHDDHLHLCFAPEAAAGP